jgi:oligopeptide transport system substrate-binding protein
VLAVGCSPRQRADLVVHNGPEPETIDPQVLTGQADGRVAAALFEGLTRFNPVDGRAIPGLAESWEISPDGRRYRFRLREGIVWSTGEPIRAEDFVWSWRRAVMPATAADYSAQFFHLENGEAIVTGKEKDVARLGVEAPDARTVEVRLVNPAPFFLELAASRIFAPIPRHLVDRFGDQWIRAEPLSCSGPYQLMQWRVNDRFRLRRNPRYWDAASVGTERIDLLSGDNAGTALNLFLRGDVDLIIDRKIIPGELGPDLAQRPDFHRFDFLGCDFIRFNTGRKPFDDPKVRKAFALALDRPAITRRITRLGERPTGAITPLGAGGYEPPQGMGLDVEQARRLLAEAGFPEGRGFPRVEYTYNVGTRLYEQVGVEIQAQLLAHLGVRIQLRPLEWKTYLTEMSRQNYDFIRGSWIGDYNDPLTFLDCFLSDSGNNRTGWRQPRYDALLRSAGAAADPAARLALLRRAEVLLVEEEVPVTGLYSYVGLCAYRTDRLGGFHVNLIDEHPLWSLRRIAPR